MLCRFPPDLIKPLPSPEVHPAVVLKVLVPLQSSPETWRVVVCYGTSNRSKLFPTEFEIVKHPAHRDIEIAGLHKGTKFDLAKRVLLPYTDEWFQVPTYPRFGDTPKLGILTPAAATRLSNAWRAASSR